MKFSMHLILSFLLGLVHATQAIDEFPRDYQGLHKYYRAQVGVRRMRWDPKLEKYAQKYALERTQSLQGCNTAPTGGPYGENLFVGTQGEGYYDAEVAFMSWADQEKTYYNSKTNTCEAGKVCSHYTQLVWRNSTRFGCASATCPGSNTGYPIPDIFVICSYSPPGNVPGKRPY